MLNIIKSQNYQLKRDIVIISVIIFCFLFPVIAPFLNELDIDGLNGSGYLLSVLGVIPMIFMIQPVFIVSKICGADMGDKTMNYEMLSGHSRGQVYFARVITSLIWTMLSMVLCAMLPVFAVTVIKGWGHYVILKDVIIRFLLVMLVYARWISVIILMVFMLGNGVLGGVISFLLFDATAIVGMIAEEMYDKSITNISSSTSVMWLTTITNYRNQVIDGDVYSVYDASLSANEIYSTVAISVFVIVLCLAIGYSLFNKRDIR